MKKLIVAVIVLLSVVVVNCRKDLRNDDCYDAGLAASMKDSICITTCEGICACNYVTYCNECEAMKAGFRVIAGDTLPCSPK